MLKAVFTSVIYVQEQQWKFNTPTEFSKTKAVCYSLRMKKANLTDIYILANVNVSCQSIWCVCLCKANCNTHLFVSDNKFTDMLGPSIIGH